MSPDNPPLASSTSSNSVPTASCDRLHALESALVGRVIAALDLDTFKTFGLALQSDPGAFLRGSLPHPVVNPHPFAERPSKQLAYGPLQDSAHQVVEADLVEIVGRIFRQGEVAQVQTQWIAAQQGAATALHVLFGDPPVRFADADDARVALQLYDPLDSCVVPQLFLQTDTGFYAVERRLRGRHSHAVVVDLSDFHVSSRQFEIQYNTGMTFPVIPVKWSMSSHIPPVTNWPRMSPRKKGLSF